MKIIHEEPQSMGKQSGYYTNWNVKNTSKCGSGRGMGWEGSRFVPVLNFKTC